MENIPVNYKMLNDIVKILKKLDGVATLEEICNEYQTIAGNSFSFGKKMAVKSTIEMYSSDSAKFNGIQDVFFKSGERAWGLRELKTNYNKSMPKKDKRTRTPEQKLYKRVKREFKRVKYIGDILINDEEYSILIEHLKVCYNCVNSLANRKEDVLFAVALVQIGIRFYNGKYWPHVSKEIGINIDSNKHCILGMFFYKTLKSYNKLVGDPSEIVNNILMHCFITNYYSSDFFDFLFAYYQMDLNRDLDQHTKEMRSYLMNSMKKAETSARAYKIKKGTADAVTVNEHGCKIRVRNILKWMDAYLFDDVLPEKSSNRIAKLFVSWAKNSKAFDLERNGGMSRGKRGKTIFKSPKLDFNQNTGDFFILLPIQTIPLQDDEETARISWRISYGDTNRVIESEVESSVVGCKTVNIEKISIEPNDIFNSFKIELIKNDIETYKKFSITSESIRFFDDDFGFVSGNRLPCGNIYAFTKKDEKIETNAEYNIESYGNLNLYNFYFKIGDVIKKPNGKALIVGDNIEEGLIENRTYSLLAFVKKGNDNYPIFNKTPNLLFKTKTKAENGIIIAVNGKKTRLDLNNCIEFRQDDSDINCYLLNLKNYCADNGVYEIIIDIPNDRKNRIYHFAYIKDFYFNYDKNSYIFCDEGSIELPIGFESNDDFVKKTNENRFNFKITKSIEMLNFFSPDGLNVVIDTPVLKWKFDLEDDWNICAPEKLWHKEFPEIIYFSFPYRQLEIYSNFVDMDSYEESHVLGTYDSENKAISVETRKIKSWLEMGPTLHNLYIRAPELDSKFITVVTKSVLVKCNLKNDIKEKQLIIESTILGYSDCVVDIFCNGECIISKQPLKYNGTKIKTDNLFGDFEVIFFETDDEDDDDFDFGVEVFSEFDKRRFRIENTNDLSNKIIKVDYITEDKKNNSIFNPAKFYIKDFIIGDICWDEDEQSFIGKSKSSNHLLNNLRVSIELVNNCDDKVLIYYYSEDEECFIDFLYDKTLESLVLEEDPNINSTQAKKRYIMCYGDNYYHITRCK